MSVGKGLTPKGFRALKVMVFVAFAGIVAFTSIGIITGRRTPEFAALAVAAVATGVAMWFARARISRKLVGLVIIAYVAAFVVVSNVFK